MNAAELTVRKLRETFKSGKTQSVSFRKSQLRKLYDLLINEKDLLLNAMQADLNKPRIEATMAEIQVTTNDICDVLNNIDEWVKPEYVPKDIANKSKTIYNIYEPLGVSLIIGAWNYPLSLVIQPLIGAIAAGNCAVIKPSELSENTAGVIETLLTKYLDQDCYVVMQGAVEETTALLKCRFDHIFYTGSTAVGKIVMKAGAEHLSKVTLELGGKSPCYVAEDSDLTVAARRIAWGKFMNSGQTCIAPDYILCPRKIQDQLVNEIEKTVKEFYGDTPNTSPDFARIVNARHFNRVKKLMLNSGRVAFGGEVDEDDKYISPTILVDVTPSHAIMQEEIFGPILPILNVDDIDEAITFINSREKPLALYAFSKSKKILEKMASRTSSGGFHANDTMLHVAVEHLPFGGVGSSGSGSYHGKYSFEEFSHKKPVIICDQNLESINAIRYPPYTEQKLSYLRMLLGKRIKPSPGSLWYIPYFICGFFLSLVMKIFGLPRYFLS